MLKRACAWLVSFLADGEGAPVQLEIVRNHVSTFDTLRKLQAKH